MSYSVNTSDVEDKNLSDFRHNRSSSNLVAKNLGTSKIADVLWAKQQRQQNDEDTDSEISDSGNFLAKGKLERGARILGWAGLIGFVFRCLSADAFARALDGAGSADLRKDEL